MKTYITHVKDVSETTTVSFNDVDLFILFPPILFELNSTLCRTCERVQMVIGFIFVNVGKKIRPFFICRAVFPAPQTSAVKMNIAIVVRVFNSFNLTSELFEAFGISFRLLGDRKSFSVERRMLIFLTITSETFQTPIW